MHQLLWMRDDRKDPAGFSRAVTAEPQNAIWTFRWIRVWIFQTFPDTWTIMNIHELLKWIHLNQDCKSKLNGMRHQDQSAFQLLLPRFQWRCFKDVILWGHCPRGIKPRQFEKDVGMRPLTLSYGHPGSCLHAYTVSFWANTLVALDMGWWNVVTRGDVGPWLLRSVLWGFYIYIYIFIIVNCYTHGNEFKSLSASVYVFSLAMHRSIFVNECITKDSQGNDSNCWLEFEIQRVWLWEHCRQKQMFPPIVAQTFFCPNIVAKPKNTKYNISIVTVQ